MELKFDINHSQHLLDANRSNIHSYTTADFSWQKNICLLLSNFKSTEYRDYETLLSQFGKVNVTGATMLSPIPNSTTDLVVVPNRFINKEFDIEHDSLIDEYFLISMGKKFLNPTLFLGRSGLINTPVGNKDKYKLISPQKGLSSGNIKKVSKCQLTPEGRKLLDIPTDVKDDIYISYEHSLFPRIIIIPEDATILATINIDGTEFCAGYHDKKNNVTCLFSNSAVVANIPGGFVNNLTSNKKGDLLFYYVINYLLQI